uniref:Small RNA 2'-O-methyltransferase n=1 Tax=Leersia perrieri TaxID=77586 RepID=A0A0D9WVU4_9ORYZ
MLSKDMRRHKGQPARGYYTYEECITYWRLHREKYPADLTPEEKIPKRQKIEEERERQRRLSKEKTRKDPNTVYPYDTWEQYFKTVEDRERKAKEEEMEARARDAQMDAVRALVAELPSRLPVGKKGKGIANDNQGPNCKSAAWSLMEAQGKRGMPAPPTMTPKAVIHQKYGAKACYSVEEAREAVDGGCPGLALPQQTRSVYRCKLEIPGLAVVTPGTFVRKKDAEQAAAQIALDKLGIQATANAPSTPKEAWDELIARISGFFADENFPSSSHPLIGHMCVTFRRTGDRFGMIPLSAIAACDVKVNTLCKLVDPKAEFDPLLVLSLIYNAAKKSPGVSVSDSNLWVRNQKPYSPEAVDVALQRWTSIMNPIEVDGIFVPCVMEDEPKTMTLTLSHNEHYMGDIVSNLSASDSSLAVVSRTVGKASSEIRLYFSAPNVQFVSEMSNNGVASLGDSNMECVINRRASYISGQTIYGDAILANVGYTGRDSELHTEDVTLSTYYRILLGKLPDGNYKMSRDSILVAELPSGYSRSSWKGLSPRYLLCSFCRLQRLAEPYFNVSTASASCKVLGSAVSSEGMEVLKNAENQYGGDGSNGKENPDMFKCEVKIYSKMQKLLLEYSTANIWSKESDAIHNSSLKVLIWFHSYFKQLNMHGQKFSLSKSTDGFRIYADNFLDEFAMFLSIYGNTGGDESSACSTAGSLSMDISEQKLENNAILTHIEGPDSGIYPSHGSLTCISYTASLVVKDKAKRYLLESNNEFEFEIGTRAVRNQLESCVSQLSVNQSACFIAELPPRDLILAAASEFSHDLSNISRDNCLLEFSVKVTEPLEDRMEKALFNPPLSKQRVEFAVRHINELHATTLVDFGCGSGSLLDSLLEHPTTLEKIVGVDISRKGLTRAAKRLAEPYFNVSTASASCKVLGSAVSSEGMEVLKNAENQYGGDGSNGKENPDMFKCEVKIYSKMQKLLLEYSTANIWSKESDAIHNSSLKVLIWFHSYFKQLNMHGQKFSLSKSTDGFRIYADNFLDEFAMFLSIYGNTGGDESSACSTAGSLSMDISEQKLENNAILTHIEGPDSGIYPSHGSLTCISYTASLVVKDKAKRYLLESNNEFEFEIGTRAVRNQLESCVSQLSVNQSACFIAELPPRDLILAAASEFSHDLSNISRDNCLLEFSVKVTEPLEDRMEKALFNPPLSKQRVEFAVRHINELHATTLVDFGCGSGSLLDSLLEHPTTLEKIVGVDISRKGLTRAAKSLHQKLSKKSLMHTTVPTAVLYDGSITDFDSRLYRFDIGTCLEVIEHVEEEQASLFGDVVLSSFCPTVLIVSTPNYEYNPILQRSAMPNKEDEPEENTGPCKFRNHDHKFEWTRAQFQHWATGLAEKHNYSVEFSGVGGSGEEPGFASQIAVFRRMAPSQEEVCQDGELHQPYEEGELEVALGVFRNMVEQGVRPNQAAVVTALSAAARLGLLEHGKFVHDVVRRAGMSVSMNVGTALVDMYAKCGCVDVAREVFDGMKRRDVFSWNAMICGLAAHGLGRDAVELFERFISEGLCPTNVTFVGVLNGCSRSGLVTEGRRYFKLMVEEYHIEPEMEHYGCMVDLLGRAGLVPEAIELIEGMHIAPDPVLWGTVLSSCKTHGLVDLGVSVGNKLIELDPTHDGYYVLLSSIYAKANKWDEVRKVRKLMSSRGTSKSAAWSLMEAQGKVHKFLVGDTYHKDSVQIYDTLDMINKRLTEAGYVPDVSSVLHDIGDEEKVGAIKVHSERLAIAYGFIVLKSGSPIRIVKNLRVCGDCHEFIKMVTMVFKMEIISLHQKLSKKSLMHISIPTAVLYDGQ